MLRRLNNSAAPGLCFQSVMPDEVTLSAELHRLAPEILRVPGWERFPWLCAGFSTRQGGRSMVYGDQELNLGWTPDDDAITVAANRQSFALAVSGGLALPLTTVAQVHGTRVRNLEQETGPFRSAEGKALLEGDGLVAGTAGRLLAVLTADCVPVLLADTRTHAVGALHAGWRGTLAGIVSLGIQQMQASFGSSPGDLVAAIGPCIGACCFEVGPEVRAAFQEQWNGAETLFQPGDGPHSYLDLVEANRRELLRAGVPHENISTLNLCTACARTADGERRFFSYRAEGGRTGRMLSAIGSIA